MGATYQQRGPPHDPLDPDKALRGLMKIDPEPITRDPEACARGEHIRWDATTEDKHAITSLARIEADGQCFERREQGRIAKRDALRKRTADAVVRDYFDFIERSTPD